MNESVYEYNNIDLVVVKNPEYYTVCATQYYYRKLGGGAYLCQGTDMAMENAMQRTY